MSTQEIAGALSDPVTAEALQLVPVADRDGTSPALGMLVRPSGTSHAHLIATLHVDDRVAVACTPAGQMLPYTGVVLTLFT